MIFNHNRHNGLHDGHNGNDAFFIVSIVQPIVSIVVKENGGYFFDRINRIYRIGL